MMYLLIGSLHIFLGQITNDSSTIDQVSVQMFDIRDRIGQQSFAGPEIRIIRISGKSTGYFYIPNYCTNSLGCIQHKFYRDNLYILDNWRNICTLWFESFQVHNKYVWTEECYVKKCTSQQIICVHIYTPRRIQYSSIINAYFWVN